MASVEARDIVKHFGEVKAVNGVSLASEEGEFLVLLGPSGCGKTTLLRTIAGLDPPTSGDVLIGGQVVTHLPPRNRGIAMVFQSYALYPHLTIFNNIAFPLKAQKVPKNLIRERVHKAATMFKIEGFLRRKPRELSGGERQRVALARALVREPNVFLLDEPLSNLDAKLRASAREELANFQKKVGITTIYVTHDQVEAMGMGDRIAVMSEGTVRQLSTPSEIYNDPADTFVAGFLGSPPMNLVKRPDVIVGFRPESFLPKDAYEGHADLELLEFHVTRVEYLGSDRLLYGNLGERFKKRHVAAKLTTSIDTPISTGRTHEFAVPRGTIRFFDRDTGLRTDPVPL
ncbi:MAG: ABC transporter ATP-binding protein [Deltaproteobacteria bacterium]